MEEEVDDGRQQARRGRGSISPLNVNPLADDEDEPPIEEEEAPEVAPPDANKLPKCPPGVPHHTHSVTAIARRKQELDYDFKTRSRLARTHPSDEEQVPTGI
ncbi:unnamed protein product [Vitrella brassicaformis CCMP3155]|uniref:Uncharacterized protein n=1 Tax=Vitrella brassicaformis (strain CCMP3155) TaxID=1169540 RepID=A0A0G4EMZ1_VITBC|nr:unnamed protein product [Vitrella brassicaformis CCMP3155]|eukprot:CEL98387.1 unnamed protein product [Vitrella brassicaformis CCMP3155]